MLQNQSFTDPQGQTFTDAVIRVKFAELNKNSYSNSYESVTLNLADPSADLTVNTSEDSSDNSSVRVEFVYWPDQAAFDSGKYPYTLPDTSNQQYSNTFNIYKDVLTSPAYSELSLEEQCEKYLIEEILPNLTA